MGRACWPIAARPTKAGGQKDKTLRSPSEAGPQTPGLTSSDGRPAGIAHTSTAEPSALGSPESPRASLGGRDTLGDLRVAFAGTWVASSPAGGLFPQKGGAVRAVMAAEWLEVSCRSFRTARCPLTAPPAGSGAAAPSGRPFFPGTFQVLSPNFER